MTASTIDVHNGVRFKVEAFPKGDLFIGRFTLLDSTAADRSATTDSYRPSTGNAWATPEEALTYATEAAHHAIEGIAPFTQGEPQAETGHGT